MPCGPFKGPPGHPEVLRAIQRPSGPIPLASLGDRFFFAGWVLNVGTVGGVKDDRKRVKVELVKKAVDM